MKEIVYQNKRVSYYTGGSGKAIVLVHGFAEDSNVWQYQFKELSKKFYVIVPDLPGSGQSEVEESTLLIEDYAEVIKAIADVELRANKNIEGTNSCTLVGHSMGGYITLAFAEKYPELLDSICLFHSTAYADDQAKKDVRQKGIEFIKCNGAAAFIKKTSANLFSEKTKKENPALVEKLMEQYKDFSPVSLVQYYEAMIRRQDRVSVLQTFQKPVLFIIGKEDAAVPLQSSLQQCHEPGVSHIHILNNSGHMGMWEEKERSTEILLSFLTR